MKITILGTGGVGKAFASRLSGLGHEVTAGTRNVAATLEKEGEAGFKDFLSKNPGVKLAGFAEAAAWGELIVNVLKGEHSLDVMKIAGIEHLKGKVLIDISNPLDFSRGMPPSLLPGLCNTTSLGEEIQKLLPETFVVKTLNTMWNGLMIDPMRLANGDHINYICGNSAEAKSKVISFLKELGWKDESLLDLGDISGARATEAILPIWLRIYGVKKSGAFNFRIVS